MARAVKLMELKAVCDRINEIRGYDPHRIGVGLGHYYLQGAYGGYQLQRVVNESGGVEAITPGFLPKRELLALMHAYLRGMTDRNWNTL
jgi:hypothetical protein